MNAIRGIRCLDIAVGNLEVTSEFYGSIWGLKAVAQTRQARFFRGTAHYHHILGLFQVGKPALLRIIFDAPDRTAIDGLFSKLRLQNVPAEKPHELRHRPGGGYGFGFKDPEGRNLAVLCDVSDHRDARPEADRPSKITHINLNSGAAGDVYRFYVDTLGFRLSDESELFYFLRCNSDHHSILLAKMSAPTLNHVSFEMTDIDSVMRGAGRMKENGYPIEWGPGRHGAGNNMFCYFAGPEELPIEYTTDVEQVDGNYVSHGPDYWKFLPGRTDRWGVTGPRSPRLKRIQELYRFVDDLRLGDWPPETFP
jgi:catechol 2,3-dioxygenase-like lactoylglutathione lyase family enzyme